MARSSHHRRRKDATIPRVNRFGPMVNHIVEVRGEQVKLPFRNPTKAAEWLERHNAMVDIETELHFLPPGATSDLIEDIKRRFIAAAFYIKDHFSRRHVLVQAQEKVTLFQKELGQRPYRWN